MLLPPAHHRGSSQRCANDGSAVIRRRWAVPCAVASADCSPSSRTDSALCTLRNRAAPAAFNTSFRPRRSNTSNPICSSSVRICWLTALCVMCSRSAAARSDDISATIRNAGSVLSGNRAIWVV
jgi:hypothetical protein